MLEPERLEHAFFGGTEPEVAHQVGVARCFDVSVPVADHQLHVPMVRLLRHHDAVGRFNSEPHEQPRERRRPRRPTPARCGRHGESLRPGLRAFRFAQTRILGCDALCCFHTSILNGGCDSQRHGACQGALVAGLDRFEGQMQLARHRTTTDQPGHRLDSSWAESHGGGAHHLTSIVVRVAGGTSPATRPCRRVLRARSHGTGRRQQRCRRVGRRRRSHAPARAWLDTDRAGRHPSSVPIFRRERRVRGDVGELDADVTMGQHVDR